MYGNPRHATREKLKRALLKRRRGGGNTRYGFHLDPNLGDGSKIEYLGKSQVKFTYPCGHYEIKDWGKGIISKRIPPVSVQQLVGMWNCNGLNVPVCQVCFKKGIGVQAQRDVALQNMKEMA
jgi:hypothetical protein